MLEAREALKPYEYQWAVEAAMAQQNIHWLPREVPMGPDVKDWAILKPHEKNLARNIMLLFTQSDVDVNNGYVDHYMRRIRNPEIRFMLQTFSAQEVIHIFAYSHLLETLGFPDSAYSEFRDVPAMAAKHDYVARFNSGTDYDLALTMAYYGGFMEGLQLYGSFIMLLNFQRFSKLRGMGQIVAWSVRDETLHSTSICRMHREFRNRYLSPAEQARIKDEIRDVCVVEAVSQEDAFIDKAFELGPVEGLTPERVKNYIRYLADVRLAALDVAPMYGIERDPEPWFSKAIGGVEHANFFESRPTAYSKAASTGNDWL